MAKASDKDIFPRYLFPKFFGQYPYQQVGLSINISSGFTKERNEAKITLQCEFEGTSFFEQNNTNFTHDTWFLPDNQTHILDKDFVIFSDEKNKKSKNVKKVFLILKKRKSLKKERKSFLF